MEKGTDHVCKGRSTPSCFFAGMVSPLTVIVSSPPLLQSLSALASSPHFQRRRIVVVRISGQLLIARRLEMAGLGGVRWSARRYGTLTWSP